MAKILKEIKSKVIKIESVKWQELKQLQTDNFKELTKENYEKLKASLINNNFVMAFTIWEDKAGVKYIIDGVHRFKTLQLLKKENYKVPDKLPAIFIDCKDKKEAVKILLLYSSQYAVATDTGMSDLINLYQLDIDKLIPEINIPEINLNYEKIEDINRLSEWDGMPDFQEHKANEPQIVIYFENEADREKFEKLGYIKIAKKVGMSWVCYYPEKKRNDLKSLKYEK